MYKEFWHFEKLYYPLIVKRVVVGDLYKCLDSIFHPIRNTVDIDTRQQVYSLLLTEALQDEYRNINV